MTTSTASLRTRWAALGAAVAVTIGAAGMGGYGLVSAEISSGDKPILTTIDACRLADTRVGSDNVGPRSTPLGMQETHTFDSGQAGTPCAGIVPPSATSLALNVTAVGATTLTFLTIWSEGSVPKVSSLNPDSDQPPTPNAVVTQLSASNTFEVYNHAGTVDVIIDVVGYYEDHNHDDRYAPRADALLLATYDFEFSDASGWLASEMFNHRAAVGSGCAYAQLDIPAGRTIDRISLPYIASDAVSVDLMVVGQKHQIGSYDTEDELFDQAVDESLTGFAVASSSVGELEVKLPDSPVIKTDFAYHLELCTPSAISFFPIKIELG